MLALYKNVKTSVTSLANPKKDLKHKQTRYKNKIIIIILIVIYVYIYRLHSKDFPSRPKPFHIRSKKLSFISSLRKLPILSLFGYVKVMIFNPPLSYFSLYFFHFNHMCIQLDYKVLLLVGTPLDIQSRPKLWDGS